MEIPSIGSVIHINSLKHDQTLHRRWEENIVLYSDQQRIIGGNNKTIVEEAGGNRWRTKEPAIFYFDRRYWFNIIFILGKDESFYYCNISSPYTYKNRTIQYIDYDIDIIVSLDWSYKILDQEEYETNNEKYTYPITVQQAIETDLIVLQNWIQHHHDPFNESFIHYWYDKFLTLQSEV